MPSELIVSAIATYSISVVESVLEYQHTRAPAHVITPPETDPLSVAYLV